MCKGGCFIHLTRALTREVEERTRGSSVLAALELEVQGREEIELHLDQLDMVQFCVAETQLLEARRVT